MDLAGGWLAVESTEERRRSMAEPGLDDSDWSSVDVPGHWRSHPDLATSDGPILYRTRFSVEPPPSGRRSFLTFDGIFYQGDAWLDGAYLGDTEGYFFPHTFEVTPALAAQADHVLAVEVACARPAERTAKRNLTGVFQHWDCIDPDWNPGGIWRPVRVHHTGPVRIRALKVLCREAGEERATLDLEAELDALEAAEVRVSTAVTPESGGDPVAAHDQDQALSAGINTVRWRVAVERPALWWPRALGAQPLHRVTVEVVPSTGGDPAGPSDRREVVTGLRQVRVRNFVATVNGERLHLKGVNAGPTRRELGEVTGAELERDVELAAAAGLDLIRVHAHISRPELYAAADRAGMLIWQDLPLQWGYGQVRRQAVAQARRAVTLLGHHPSVALWCGHNEPFAVAGAGPADRPGRSLRAQLLPSWNRTGLDRSVRRALERADGSRRVVAHSGVLPHPAWGTDSHLYYGWYHGQERDLPAALARFPVLARFVSEFGAQAVPATADFMAPDRWPDLDWDHLVAHHGLQREIFDARVPPGDHRSFDSWRAATQAYQADLLRAHIEALRRLKYRPSGGFCVFMLADAQPAVSWSVLDHDRVPKAGYRAVAEACAPVIVTADRPAAEYRPGGRIALGVHVVSDLRTALAGAVAEVELTTGDRRRRWRFEGDVAADACSRIGRISHTVEGRPGEGIELALRLTWAGGAATNSYRSRIGA